MKKFILAFGLVLAMAIPALAADSTSLFNEKVLGTKIEKASGGGGVPVGTVIAWPANSNPEDPENWLECNGQGISHSVYPELFAVVGGAVPNYQRYFLRGVGGSSAGLGQVQGDAMHAFSPVFCFERARSLRRMRCLWESRGRKPFGRIVVGVRQLPSCHE